MPPFDETFSRFLGHLPKQTCLQCLTEIYGTPDPQETAARLRELGDAIDTVEATCGNCEAHTTTYRIRHH